jgi:hypothetical protein
MHLLKLVSSVRTLQITSMLVVCARAGAGCATTPEKSSDPYDEISGSRDVYQCIENAKAFSKIEGRINEGRDSAFLQHGTFPDYPIDGTTTKLPSFDEIWVQDVPVRRDRSKTTPDQRWLLADAHIGGLEDMERNHAKNHKGALDLAFSPEMSIMVFESERDAKTFLRHGIGNISHHPFQYIVIDEREGAPGLTQHLLNSRTVEYGRAGRVIFWQRWMTKKQQLATRKCISSIDDTPVVVLQPTNIEDALAKYYPDGEKWVAEANKSIDDVMPLLPPMVRLES